MNIPNQAWKYAYEHISNLVVFCTQTEATLVQKNPLPLADPTMENGSIPILKPMDGMDIPQSQEQYKGNSQEIDLTSISNLGNNYHTDPTDPTHFDLHMDNGSHNLP